MQFQIPMKLYNQFIILIYFTCEINFIMKLHSYIELLKLINVKSLEENCRLQPIFIIKKWLFVTKKCHLHLLFNRE